MASSAACIRKILEKLRLAGEAKVELTTRQKLAIAFAVVVTCLALQLLLFRATGLWGFDALLVGCLLAGAFLGGRYAIAVPITIAACYYSLVTFFGPWKHAITGLLHIYAVCLFAYAVCGLLGKLLKARFRISLGFAAELTGLGIVAAFVWGFIVDTGWWWIMYPHTPYWLAVSYLGGLPYTLRRILSTLILTPALSIPLLVACQRVAVKVPVKAKVVVVAKLRRRSSR